jgi:acyl-coenzyme A thioesterase 13
MIITIFESGALFFTIHTSFCMTDENKPIGEQDNHRLTTLQQFIGKPMSQSVSPTGRWLNGTLLDIREGSMEVEVLIREEMTNPMGTLHGGMAAVILDEVVGTMVYALGREYAYTSVNLNCDFLHAARLGDTVICKAGVVRAGKNIVHVEGVIYDLLGKIIAKCTSNLIQTSLKIPF